MFKVYFFLRNAEKSTSQSAELTIYCQLAIEGMKRDTAFSTKLRVPLMYWKTEAHQQDDWVLDDYYQADSLNRRLLEITLTLHRVYDSMPLLYSYETITYTHIRRHYDPDSVKPLGLLELKVIPTIEEIYLEFLEEKQRRIGIKELTQKSYRSRINNIYAFFGRSKRVSTIRHKELDTFERWMIEQKNELGEPRFCRNYRNKHLTLVYDLVGFAVKKDYLQAMPLVALELRYDPIKPPQYLLPEQREALMAVDVPSLRKAQDIAQFLMHTGFSWVDYKKLNSGHLLGRCWRVQRNKSDIWSMPILLPEAKAIIEKYGSIEKLPRYDASDLNKDLKHLAHCAGIAKDLQHPLRISDFRETFASMLENEFMLEPRIVQVMIGHTNPRQIQSYSRLMPERILYELDQWRCRTGMIAPEVQA